MGDCFAPLGPPLLPWDSMAQAHRQTDGHGDSMTNSAQWARVGENLIKLHKSPQTRHMNIDIFN